MNQSVRLLSFLCLLWLWSTPVVRGQILPLADPLPRLTAAQPSSPAACTADASAQMSAAATATEAWFADMAWRSEIEPWDQFLGAVGKLILAKAQVDAQLDRLLAQRSGCVTLAGSAAGREQICRYLEMTSQMIDLSGRLRYLLHDAIDEAAYQAAADPQRRHRLLDLLIQHQVGTGATVMSVLLVDPPAETGLRPVDDEIKAKVLRLIAATGEIELLPDVAALIRARQTSSSLVLLAADVIRRIGLPQDPHPEQDPALPPPPITAGDLARLLAAVEPARLSPALAALRTELLTWLEARQRRGVTEEGYRVGRFEVRPGDWLLMRNPSPYNLFTDLSPGLFTHVGVVAAVQDPGGRRRLVIVDLPERGSRIPVMNVEAYLGRTLHYFFLRHDDPTIGQRMGQVAASLIGNPTQFDLTFRTSRVLELQGKPLRGQPINTYCAGFLLLCAQETTAPRSDFFPILETPAKGNTLANLAKLGMSIGDDFVSPTGAIFSSHLSIVGRCEPMYDPGREIKERIYDYFALAMKEKSLTPSPDAYQMLRQRLAEMSRASPLLAKALATANGVSEHMDLVSAAKAATVVESLDAVADTAAAQYEEANQAFYAGSIQELTAARTPAADIERIQRYRQVHAALYRRWDDDTLTARELRMALVDYYSDQGQRSLDARFFSPGP